MSRARWWKIAGVALALGTPFAVRAGASSDRELIGQLDREVIALRQKLQMYETRLESCGTRTDAGPIYTELVQVFSGSAVKVEHAGGDARVTLPGDMLFSINSLAIREEAGFALDLLGTALKLHTDVRVLLVGYTDSELPSGPFRKLFPSNWELSYARALAVARALSEQHGVPIARITVAGRADQDPISGNDTPDGRALNRRVVALLTPGAPP